MKVPGRMRKLFHMRRKTVRSLSLTLPSTDEEERTEMDDLEGDEEMVFVKFMRAHRCYDVVPVSSKLVVFDNQLNVKKAFYALVYNGVRSAPLWNSASQVFIGMLTITDFIKILHRYYRNPLERMEELEEHKIQTWRDELEDYSRPLISIAPSSSLLEAIKMLAENKVHRLPVIDPDTGNVLYILTHKRIIRYLYIYINDIPLPSYMSRSLEELNIGTFNNIAMVQRHTLLIEALNIFLDRRVSALPVVDKEGKVVDIYAKFDVISLASENKFTNLDISIAEALEFRRETFEGVQTCSRTDPFRLILKKIVEAEVHRLVVVNELGCVEGIVSLSDILHYLVLRPLRDDQQRRASAPASAPVTSSSKDEQGACGGPVVHFDM